MKLIDLLNTISQTAKKKGLSTPYIVGGTPRDRIRGASKEINDLDLTSAEGDSIELAFACAEVVRFKHFQLYDDGHVSLNIENLKVDFSNHFVIPGIEQELSKLGITKQTPLVKEMYSRDFTMNTLLQDMSLDKIYDITGQAVKDIRSGMIRTPINAELTISSDPKRILRAIRFALKFDFTIADELQAAIKKYNYLLKNNSIEYLKDKTNELIRLNPKKALDYLIEFGLLNIVPMTKLLSDKLIENKMLYYAFSGKNTNKHR